MTDTRKLAERAGAVGMINADCSEPAVMMFTAEQLDEFARLVREECASTCEDEIIDKAENTHIETAYNCGVIDCMTAIRALSAGGSDD